jgi:hypothetical protein
MTFGHNPTVPSSPVPSLCSIRVQSVCAQSVRAVFVPCLVPAQFQVPMPSSLPCPVPVPSSRPCPVPVPNSRPCAVPVPSSHPSFLSPQIGTSKLAPQIGPSNWHLGFKTQTAESSPSYGRLIFFLSLFSASSGHRQTDARTHATSDFIYKMVQKFLKLDLDLGCEIAVCWN